MTKKNNKIKSLNKQIEDMKDINRKICNNGIVCILKALNMKDHYSFNHSLRTSFYSLIIGHSIKMNDEDLYQLELTGLVHDIGKIGISDSILLKKEKLTYEEFNIIKTHPDKSAQILEGFTDFETTAYYARHHHERYDGKGYPDNLKSEEIPLHSRIVFIADAYDSMTAKRPYSNGIPHKEAIKILQENSFTQFDGDLVKHFIKNINKKNVDDIPFKLDICNQYLKKAA